MKEVNMLATITKNAGQHDNIIQHLEVFDNGGCYASTFLVMDFCSGGELHTYLAVKENRVIKSSGYDMQNLERGRQVTRQVVSALAHMHRIDIAHLDLKPQNIVFTTE